MTATISENKVLNIILPKIMKVEIIGGLPVRADTKKNAATMLASLISVGSLTSKGWSEAISPVLSMLSSQRNAVTRYAEIWKAANLTGGSSFDQAKVSKWLIDAINSPDFSQEKKAQEKKETPQNPWTEKMLSSPVNKYGAYCKPALAKAAPTAVPELLNMLKNGPRIITGPEFFNEAKNKGIRNCAFANSFLALAAAVGIVKRESRQKNSYIYALPGQDFNNARDVQPVTAKKTLLDTPSEVLYEHEHKDITVCFKYKPNSETRAQLKRNGFRWSPMKSAWNAAYTYARWKWANALMGKGVSTTPAAQKAKALAPKAAKAVKPNHAPSPITTPTEGAGRAEVPQEIQKLISEGAVSAVWLVHLNPQPE